MALLVSAVLVAGAAFASERKIRDQPHPRFAPPAAARIDVGPIADKVDREAERASADWGEADEFGSALLPQQIIQSVVARLTRSGKEDAS